MTHKYSQFNSKARNLEIRDSTWTIEQKIILLFAIQMREKTGRRASWNEEKNSRSRRNKNNKRTREQSENKKQAIQKIKKYKQIEKSKNQKNKKSYTTCAHSSTQTQAHIFKFKFKHQPSTAERFFHHHKLY